MKMYFTPGHLYFIQSSMGGPIKIGYAKDVGSRLSGLRRSLNDPTLVIRFCLWHPSAYRLEQSLHYQLRDVQTSNGVNDSPEWFEDCQAVRDWMKRLIEGDYPPLPPRLRPTSVRVRPIPLLNKYRGLSPSEIAQLPELAKSLSSNPESFPEIFEIAIFFVITFSKQPPPELGTSLMSMYETLVADIDSGQLDEETELAHEKLLATIDDYFAWCNRIT